MQNRFFTVGTVVQILVTQLLFLCMSLTSQGQEWRRYPIPVDAGPGREWRIQGEVSDDFEYEFGPKDELSLFGDKWRNHYIGNWNGPGTTIWSHENVSVTSGHLRIRATRVPGELKSFESDTNNDGINEKFDMPATRLGCVTSIKTIQYPALIEARVKIPNAVVAANVWLLSPDSTQEIDVLETYGGRGDDNRSDWLAQRIHLSHHVFIRNPFQDYQPHDKSTWYTRPGMISKNGRGYWTNNFHRIGVFWRDPSHLEYFLDGKLVKTTSGMDNSDSQDGIDPLGYTKDATGKRTGLNKPMHLIINMETQTWNATAGRTPTNEEIKRRKDHTYLIDWIRVYKLSEDDTIH